MLHRYRALFLALSVAILLLLAYTLYWNAAANRLNGFLLVEPMKPLVTGQKASVEIGPGTTGGFPLRLTARWAHFKVTWPDGTVLETGPLVFSAWAWEPLAFQLESDAPVRLTVPGTVLARPINAHAASLRGSIAATMDEKIIQVSVSLAAVEAVIEGGTGPLKASELTLTWTAPAQPPTGPTDSQGQTSLVITGLDLPGAVPAPLQQRIDQVALSYEPRGPLPAKPSVEGMAAWRDGGGTLDIRSFRVLWSGMDLRANATLALDRDMQPEGAGTAELSGADALIDVMGARGNIPADRVAVMKQGLQGLTRRTDDGRDILSVPVTLQNRRLSVGPIVVGVMPVVPWN